MKQEEIVFQRRNRLKKHFVNTSNVLLYCYQTISDAAKITFQVIDGFDWESKETGDSKGYAFPAVETLAKIRRTSARTIQRHILELVNAELLTRIRRRNKPSVLYIEEVSNNEANSYLARYVDKTTNKNGDKDIVAHFRNDKNVASHKASETTKMSLAYRIKENELKKQNKINVNDNFKISTKKGGEAKSIKDLLIQFELKMPRKKRKERKTDLNLPNVDREQRDYLASEMATRLNDHKSLGCFKTIAEKVPQMVIFEVLSSIKETARDGKIKVSKGALFVDIMQGYCEGHGINLGFKTKTGKEDNSSYYN